MSDTPSQTISESLHFENEVHQNVLLKNLKNMYDAGELCDVTLCLSDKKYRCHRNVLAATSPYFMAMFTAELNEKYQGEITIHEVDPGSMELLIDYAYSGVVDVTKSNAQNLLAAASLFQISPVYKACAKFMESQLDVSNCIGIHYFAQVHSCTELQVKAKEFIEKNFVEVSHTGEFMLLDWTKMAELIASNELNVEKEEVVFEVVMRWLNNDRDKNSLHIADVLSSIRFGLLPSKFIQEQVLANKFILASKNCDKLLEELKEFEENPDTCAEVLFSATLRSGMIKPELCVLFIGGVNQTRPSINCYNPLTREAYYMSDFSNANEMGGYFDVEDPACVVTEENQVFVAGGNYVYHENYGETPSEDSFDDFDVETVRKDFYLYDNDHDVWLAKAPMLFPKSNFALAHVNGKIYCFGGLTINQHPTEIIESYDLEENRWSYVGMMPMTLVDLSVIALGTTVYLLGGRTGVGAHNVVSAYDTVTWEWRPLAGMPTPRFNFGACYVDGEIYVAGGQIYSHSSHTITREALSSVEIYSIEQNQWRQGPNLPENMYKVGLFRLGSWLYACGTTEFHRSAYRVYRYNDVYRLDLVRLRWEKLESDLCDIRDYNCVMAKMHTRKLSQVFRPEVDT